MRAPERRGHILTLIGQIWEESPDLRLNQLIGNVLSQAPEPQPLGVDPYYVEDDIMIQKLENYLMFVRQNVRRL